MSVSSYPDFVYLTDSNFDKPPYNPAIARTPYREALSGEDFAQAAYDELVPRRAILEITTTAEKTYCLIFRGITWRGPARLLRGTLKTLKKDQEPPAAKTYFSLATAAIQDLVKKVISAFSSTPAQSAVLKPAELADNDYFGFSPEAWEPTYDKGNYLGVMKTVRIIPCYYLDEARTLDNAICTYFT